MRLKKYSFQIICILPLLIFLFFFTLVPIIRLIFLSLEPLGNAKGGWFTLAHYRELFTHGAFKEAFFNTLIIALGSLFIELGLGLVLAMILSRNYRHIRILRPLFILPLAIPTAVAGVMMTYLFATSGWINRILSDTGLINSSIHWMAGGWQSLLMVVLADCWKVTPLVMLILLAGLQSIDSSLYKAARIDGAGSLYIFRRITLPLLMPFITAAVIIRGIDAFRIFALPLILMGQNLRVIGTYAYLEYMEFNNPYLSAASSTVLMAMILIAVLIYIKVAGKRGLAVA
jgi:trehalose transport system permease protein